MIFATRSVKLFRCDCGKEYKTPYGLKNHVTTQHQPGAVNKFQTMVNSSSIRMDVIPMKQSVYDSSSSQPSTNTSNSSGINLPSLQSANKNLVNESNEPKIEDSTTTVPGEKKSDPTIIQTNVSSDINVVKSEQVLEINSSSTLQQHLLRPISARTILN